MSRKTFEPPREWEDPFAAIDDDRLYSMALSEGLPEEVLAREEEMAPEEFRDYLIGLLAGEERA